jgi:hypothetical protein
MSNLSRKEPTPRTLNNLKIKNNHTAEKNTLYQTNSPSLREISFPKTPVNPARITAICNNKYDLFIKTIQ